MKPIILKTPNALNEWRKGCNGTVGFVPTMGALHAGHVSLIEKCIEENKLTLVSIFVNPLQFGPNEDYAAYPRNFNLDLALLEKLHVNAVYMPLKSFPIHRHEIFLFHHRLGHQYCGASRPTFFRGVLTVVMKLMLASMPYNIYLGKKDFQQALLIKQMVAEYALPIKVRCMPTVRQKNGLALSSRNAYLSSSEAAKASCVYAALLQVRKLLKNALNSFDKGEAKRKHVRSVTSGKESNVKWARENSTDRKIDASRRYVSKSEVLEILQSVALQFFHPEIFRIDYFVLASRNYLQEIAAFTVGNKGGNVRTATATSNKGVVHQTSTSKLSASELNYRKGKAVLLIAVFIKTSISRDENVSHSAGAVSIASAQVGSKEKSIKQENRKKARKVEVQSSNMNEKASEKRKEVRLIDNLEV